jgi:GTP-binding protein HflX
MSEPNPKHQQIPPPDGGFGPHGPSAAELDLEDRSALRRVAGLSTELADVTEVEYRRLRLERVVLVGVWAHGSAEEAEASLGELARLAETAGSEVLDGLIQRRSTPDQGTYIGSGKVGELRDVVLATGADTVVCDRELAPGQLRQLEDKLAVKVVDRTALILDIFAQHARSKEGKAQVELSQLAYLLPRLRGWGASLSRQAGGRAGGGTGGVGLRGPGETKLETDRRRINKRMAKLRREIREMAEVRSTKRNRRAAGAVPGVAIAGYTNAGKSSLLSALTPARVLVQDALFATLDPTTRRAQTRQGMTYTYTDTVGFVRHLPHQLIEAFRSTLEEVAETDLLLHVLDASDAVPEQQVAAVREVISEITERRAAALPTELLVINKADVADPLVLRRLVHEFPSAMVVSAHTGQGIAELRERVAELLPHPSIALEVLIPYERGDLAAKVYQHGEVLSTAHEEDGIRLRANVHPDLAARLDGCAVATAATGR